jgi:hypothetical protein
MRALATKALMTIALLASVRGPGAHAEVFYVSPAGDDTNDGRAAQHPWKTVAKVNAAKFAPGDQVLFARGGEWRESLNASSSGAPDKPIVFAAYGKGAKPRFWGSDILKNADFKPVKDSTYSYPSTQRVASVLVDHQFLLLASDANGVHAKSGTWYCDGTMLYVNAGDKDPRNDGRTYTACVRVDCVHSNGKNQLIFRDLVADESADARDGYGFRVMGSSDVRLEDCEAYRAGRHHFGTINSTRFVGKGLHCAHAMPNISGGATFYVSFSDQSRSGDTHQWLDCSAEHFENSGRRNYQVFYDHGEGLGPILIRNLTSRGGTFSVGTSAKAPVTIEGGVLEDAPLEIFGSNVHVNGLTIRGNGAIDHYGSDGLFENLRLINLKAKNGGHTGYNSAIVLRDGARKNTLRFCTVVFGPEAPASAVGLALLGRGSATRWYGNIVQGKGPAVKSWAGDFDASDLVQADYNFYPSGAIFMGRGKAVTLKDWQARGFDPHSLTGDPLFVNAAGGDYALKPDSPAAGTARVEEKSRPGTDAAGNPRRGPVCAIGALEPRR